MQGRLCAQVGDNVQAFPWSDWETEFAVASELGIHAMEWTLDQERLYENPLMTAEGRARIQVLQDEYLMAIPSLTGDCFMQAPFWKADGDAQAVLKADFVAVCRACSALGVQIVVVPLVDHGRLDSPAQEDALVEFLLSQQKVLASLGIQVAFESDFPPAELRRFIDRLPSGHFGINYDIGNSAALGYDALEEFANYGCRVLNVHVKDRALGGSTVPLKSGAAKFDVVFAELAGLEYAGNLVLQTARATDGNHADALRSYHQMTANWIRKSGLAAAE